MPSSSREKVTPRRVVETILEELRSGIEEGYYTEFVSNIVRVYLFREDYQNLHPLEERIREEATRALNEELQRLNGGRSGPLVLPWQRGGGARRSTYRPLGDWVIHFAINDDEDAAQNPILVRYEKPRRQETEELEGAPTVRVARPVDTNEEAGTRRTGEFRDRPANAAVYAQLHYQDDSGPHTYEMSKDLIKIGRGGPNEWVDVKLLTRYDVSREHLQIRRDPATGRFFVKDLSTLGTWQNGKRLPAGIVKENGVDREVDAEQPLPAKAILDLANVLTVEFKATKQR